MYSPTYCDCKLNVSLWKSVFHKGTIRRIYNWQWAHLREAKRRLSVHEYVMGKPPPLQIWLAVQNMSYKRVFLVLTDVHECVQKRVNHAIINRWKLYPVRKSRTWHDRFLFLLPAMAHCTNNVKRNNFIQGITKKRNRKETGISELVIFLQTAGPTFPPDNTHSGFYCLLLCAHYTSNSIKTLISY